MKHAATYEVVESGPEWTTLRDLDEPGRRSITNDVERVLADVDRAGLLPPGRRLRYYDTEGALDEIVFEHRAAFVRFEPGPATRREA